ncbi:MAG: SEC-C metal-binding domain-containing protein, partial [Promicromonosporaceae bacterium]|nr:SEC-C metal-binding domain-containing protein [Promicromonosporaceae bacterium]
EFQSTYKIGVVPIPTNKPMVRLDQSDLVYKNAAGKYGAVVTDIVERHAKGQPVLVGTTSVEKSEYLSKLLRKKGVPHSVLNAKEHEREAAVVALAGRKGAVTVATNMAGRGTDIMLGGNAEFLATQEMAERGIDSTEHAEEYEAAWPAVLAEAKAHVAAEHDEVVELGGLYVLGTERHESRRIDNQLRGRSGRQGDPGESRFYLSMEDDLMRMFNAGLAESMMNRAGFPDDVPLESKMVSRGIQSAQSQVEARNFEIRKNVLKYDDVMSRQRTVIYDERRRVLAGEDLQEQIDHFRNDVIAAYVDGATAEGSADHWDLEELWTALKTVYPVSIKPADARGKDGTLSRESLLQALTDDAAAAYTAREAELGPDNMRELERRITLSVLDRKWREHLYEMDYLKEGIGLRAMAQRDPLVEYQREGYSLFNAMTDSIKEESIGFLYNLSVEVAPAPAEGSVEAGGISVDVSVSDGGGATTAGGVAGGGAPAAPAAPAGKPLSKAGQQLSAALAARTGGVGSAAAAGTTDAKGARTPRLVAKGLDEPKQQVPLTFSGPSESGGGAGGKATARNEAKSSHADGETYPGTPRNAQCPCGSGKKYKVCHGRNES